MKKFRYKIVYIIVFCVIILFPIIAKVLDVKNDLFGVEYEAELEDLNINNLMDFSFQDSLDNFITQKLPGKSLLARCRNQILYSLFGVSSNYSLNISLTGNIVFDETMDYYYHGLHEVDDKYIDELVTKLKTLNDILKSKNADLVLFVTTTKSRYIKNESYSDRDPHYNDDFVLVDEFLTKHSSFDNDNYELPYTEFINKLKTTNIKTFDCVDYISNLYLSSVYDDGKYLILMPPLYLYWVPLYYNTSHHWSNVLGNKIGIEFLDYLSNNTKVKFSKLKQSIERIDTPIFPDSDIYDLCNVLAKPKEDYFKSNIEIVDNNHSNSNVIIRGGSYLGQVPFIQGMMGESNVFFMLNTDVFKKYTEDIDLVILEINEVNVYNATFGFLDYLLDNKDKLFN